MAPVEEKGWCEYAACGYLGGTFLYEATERGESWLL
jgi:hypothetical protein